MEKEKKKKSRSGAGGRKGKNCSVNSSGTEGQSCHEQLLQESSQIGGQFGPDGLQIPREHYGLLPPARSQGGGAGPEHQRVRQRT